VLVLAKTAVDLVITLVCHTPRMACEMGIDEVPDTNGAGTLPMVSRCWASYTTFFGDGQSLSCTAADTCKRSLTDSTLVMCGACPLMDPPNPLTFHYGCDTIIKSCTCGTPRLAPAFCYSNRECEAPGQACAFIDSELEYLNVQGKEALATEEIAGHAMFRDGRTLDLDENTIKTSHNTLENTHVGPLALPKLCGSVLERVGRHVKNDRERCHNGITPRIHQVVESSFRHAVVLCYVKVRPTGQPPQSHAQLK